MKTSIIPKFQQNQKVYTFWNKQGTRCSRSQNEEHQLKRTGIIKKIRYDESRSTFVYNILHDLGFYLCEEDNLNYSEPTNLQEWINSLSISAPNLLCMMPIEWRTKIDVSLLRATILSALLTDKKTIYLDDLGSLKLVYSSSDEKLSVNFTKHYGAFISCIHTSEAVYTMSCASQSKVLNFIQKWIHANIQQSLF